MKKWQFLAILAVVAAVGMFWTKGWAKIREAQQEEASTEVVNQKYDVGSWDKVDVSNAITVEYVCGQLQPAVVQTQAWLLPYVVLENEKGELEISLDDEWKKQRLAKNDNQPDIVVKLQSPSLREVDAVGACTFKVVGALTLSEPLEIDLAGASQFIAGVVEVEECSIDAVGASSVTINNFTGRKLEVDCVGASTCRIEQLKAREANVEVTGASTVVVPSGEVDYLQAEATGASNIKMKGVKAKTGYREASGISGVSVSIDKMLLTPR